MTVRKIRAGRVTTVTMDQFVGDVGTLFYNENTGEMRVSNGVDPGGNIVSYVLPIASNVVLGGIKLGTGFAIDANGVASVIGGGGIGSIGATGATGIQGNVGPAGASSNIAVYDEGNLVVSSMSSINFVGAIVTANASSSNVTVTIVGNNLPLTSDRITSNTSQLVINGMGSQPSVTFPAGPAGQIIISEAEISTLSGNLALTSMKDAYLLANGDGSIAGGAKLWKFDRTGSVTLPAGASGDAEINIGFEQGLRINIEDGEEGPSTVEVTQSGGLKLPGQLRALNGKLQVFYDGSAVNFWSNVADPLLIRTGNNFATSKFWTFGTDGGLRTPDNQLTIGGYTIQATGNNEIDLANGPDVTIKSNVGGVTITSNWAVNPAEWGFLPDGNLELPNGTRIRDIGTIGSTSGLELGNHGFQINFGSTINDWAIFSGARLVQFEPGETFNITFGEQGWQFANTGNITFPDGTIQSTAYTGSGGAASTVNVTDTNGLTTTYYPTFVESRTTGQYVRADVDLTYRTDTNLLKSGNIQVGRNIYGSPLGGISDGIQLRPNISIDKRFLFTVDSASGTYLRSGMEMPVAEVNKAVTLGFPHTNGTVSYIYNQGTDTNGTEWNDALVIFQNGGNVKIGTITNSNGTKIWEFNQTGTLRLPNSAVIRDSATNSISFGLRAGDSGQGNLTVAIGSQAGEINQGLQSTAVGSYAGNYNQGIGTVAIGTNAGALNQGLRAVAIGGLAGAQNQGEYAVALGNFAGGTNQPNNSIIINASGVALNGSASGLFIDPVREVVGTKIVYYNSSTKEITTGPIGLTSNSNVSITSNNNVWTFGTDGSMTTPGLLKTGNIQVGRNIYGSAFYGISNAIQLRPDIDIDKRFLFTVDSSGGNYIRSGMEMPMAEVDKAVTLAFPHDNSTAGYIFNQGTDTNGTEWNDALVIFQNGGNVKIGTITNSNGTKIWEFNQTGNLTLPQTNMNASPAPVSLPGITFTDGTFQTTAYTGAAAKVDITNTNGLSNTFYPTFVEFRTTGQYVRADVDFTYRSDSNTLTVPKISGMLQGNVDHANGYINFTGSPAPGTSGITFADGTTQTTAWTRSAAQVQSTPPASPVTGQLYYDTDDGRTYIYTGAAWIDANPAGGGGSAALDEAFGNLTAATGVVTHDCTTNRLFYHTSMSANFTANFTNLNLSAGRSTSISLVLVQGGTARMVTAVQIGGVAQTITWQGSASAPAGNANRTDAVTFSILNVGGTYTVLGMMTSFGGV